jgi:deazaflavin-dependent oxidoreductase (nitroreductase family)
MCQYAPMSEWTTEELDRIGSAEELQIAPLGADGSARRSVPIWVVRVGDDLYVRSVRGAAGQWFRALRARPAARIEAGGVTRDVTARPAAEADQAAIDAAYRDKYAQQPREYVDPMVTAAVRETTLRLVPGAQMVQDEPPPRRG